MAVADFCPMFEKVNYERTVNTSKPYHAAQQACASPPCTGVCTDATNQPSNNYQAEIFGETSRCVSSTVSQLLCGGGECNALQPLNLFPTVGCYEASSHATSRERSCSLAAQRHAQAPSAIAAASLPAFRVRASGMSFRLGSAVHGRRWDGRRTAGTAVGRSRSRRCSSGTS